MSGHGHVVPNPDGRLARCGGPALCSKCKAEAWEVGQMRHADDCQILQQPPDGWPLDGFSCNCRPVYLGPVAKP